MFFTVVIPTHRRKALLEKLLHSLEKQTLPKNEFQVRIIATEADEAYSINLNQFAFEAEIISVPNDPMKGRSASVKRNFGASIAQGEWIAFTDDDCLADSRWLQEARTAILSEPVEFVEGAVRIPPPERKTFTYKGIQRLSRPGGFQTCNMFYRKKDFIEVGGFDPHFPYYLEDTDLAWTFLEKGKKQTFASKAIVSHPVPPPAPAKILESAWRMEKLPYLYKKHKKTYEKSAMRAFPRPYAILLVLDVLIFLTIFTEPKILIGALLVRLIVTGVLLFRMLWGCSTSFQEVLQMYYYLLISPLISFYSLLKGNFLNRIWIFFK